MENKSDIQTDRETLDTSNFMGSEGVDDQKGKGVGDETSPKGSETSTDGWTSIFPKEDREKYGETLKKYAKPKDLLAEYVRLAEREKRAVVMPEENASEEELKAYRKALGVPESADGYSLPKVDASNKDFEAWYRQTAFDCGLTKAQAKQFCEMFLKEDVKQMEAMAQARQKRAEESTLALKKEWGDSADVNYALAKRAFKNFGDAGFRRFVAENNLESDPRLIKTFYGIARQTGGDRGTEGSLYHEAEPKTGLHYDI